MSEIVNLRRVKKQRARASAAAEAAQNRALHGRSGAAKAAERLERARAGAVLDGHRIWGEPAACHVSLHISGGAGGASGMEPRRESENFTPGHDPGPRDDLSD